MGVQILGTSSDGVDAAEDRERFDEILQKCGIPRAKGRTIFTVEEALAAAHELGYPVLVRPSYVLGGQGMEIAYSDRNIEEFMRIINLTVQEHLIPGIMEHVERAGVHSGDSIAVYPPLHLEQKHRDLILQHTRNMAKHLGVIGLINAQYILYNDDIYVIEVNPRSSRTIPYISKVTGVPIIDLATKVMLGQKLKDLDYGTGIYKEANYFAVKAPVFSFEKLTDVDTGLGPEMKSTGEVLGIAETFSQALLKAFKGSGLRAPKRGGRIILTVKDEDKREIVSIARGFEEMGIELFATSGTCDALNEAGVECKRVNRVSQAHPNILDMIASGPAYPDSSTCAQALAVAEKYGLHLTDQMRQLLGEETPKKLDNVETVITGSVRILCAAAAESCEKLGYQATVLTDQLCCQAREAGSFLASIALTHKNTDKPLAFIAGGETVVRLTGTGKGGRNQELALAAAPSIAGLDNALIFSLGSDGTDGPTNAAGGLVDGSTQARLAEQGVSIHAVLQDNDAYHALERVGGLIQTGPTGTNVNDVAVVLLGKGA